MRIIDRKMLGCALLAHGGRAVFKIGLFGHCKCVVKALEKGTEAQMTALKGEFLRLALYLHVRHGFVCTSRGTDLDVSLAQIT